MRVWQLASLYLCKFGGTSMSWGQSLRAIKPGIADRTPNFRAFFAPLKLIVSVRKKLFPERLDFFLKVNLGLGGEARATKKERKSIGRQRTFAPISQKEKLLQILKSIAKLVATDMKNAGNVKV